MLTVIPPVDIDKLEQELKQDIFVRETNNGNNQIYVFDAHQCPDLMREIGRLREITFRDAGGGTGKAFDIDDYDIAESPFKQLIVWNPEDKAITGGYRFIKGTDILNNSEKDEIKSPTARLFEFSDNFI